MVRRLLYWATSFLPTRLIPQAGAPYLERYLVFRSRRLTAYLHRFVGEDGDRSVHDHPWSWSVSFILAGGYLELRTMWLDPLLGVRNDVRVFEPGCFNWIRPRDFHRIVCTKPNTWTLFLHGRRTKGWGFLEEAPLLHGGFEVVYSGADDAEGGRRWEKIAPRGRDSGRQPL